MNQVVHRFSVFARFCTVGVSNTIIDISVFFLFIYLGVPYLISQVLSYSVGMINSFIWNRKWTFRISHKTNRSEMIRFTMINLFALTSTNLLLALLYEVNSWPILMSKILATGGGLVITFIGTKLWVFQKNKLQES